MTKHLSWVLFLIIPVTSHAQSLHRIFADANAAYFRGDISQAVEHYERLVQAGVDDPDVYFNLATARARANQLGYAVLYFERALWLRPGDEGAARELAAARSLLGKRRAEREGEASLESRPPLFDAVFKPLSADHWGLLLLVANLIFFGVLLLRRRAQREALRLGLLISLPFFAISIAITSAGLLVRTEAFQEGSAAIVLREEAALREGPDTGAQVRNKAHEGQSARVFQREGSFAHVQLSGGGRGWMRAGDLGVIRAD